MTDHDSVASWDEVLLDFRARRATIRTDLGGSDRVTAVRATGRGTVRDRFDLLLDPDSFEELATFAGSQGRANEWRPGDGKVGGTGRVDGRPVMVAGDDVTVLRATSAVVANTRVHRLYELALRTGTPFVFFGECGGGRIPDILGALGFTQVPGYLDLARRSRRIPLAVAIVGDSFGASTLMAGLADFTVQVRGTCLAVTSARVIAVATGEQVTPDALGGADVHARRTGLVDLAVADEAAAAQAIRRFLSYLPSHADELPPQTAVARPGPDHEVLNTVPRDRRAGYDAHALVARLADDGDFFELQPQFGRSVLTGLARIGGHPVGLVVSQPSHQAGALTPDSCDKTARLICLCDAFALPVITLQDTPGFLVGSRVEHDRIVAKAMLLQQAYALARVPKLAVLLRKGFGMGYFAMGGNDTGGDLLYAWAGAEIGFMDPVVGANVVHAAELAALPEADRRARRAELAADLAASTDVLGPAGIVKIDEVIDPVDTRFVLSGALDRFALRQPVPAPQRPLANWPTSW